MSINSKIIERTKKLSNAVDMLSFTFDGYIYNPLDYAWNLHRTFLEKYVDSEVDVLFLGMNPGPFGMMQTGVPFGEINAVRNYLKIDGIVEKPEKEHPNRPVLGLNTTRSEGSGKRFWSLIQALYPNPNDFFAKHSVFNYCPLGFLMNTKTAKNETPDHLPKEERSALEEVCDDYLADIVEILRPKALIGVGKYAENKFLSLFDSNNYIISSIIHPSPGNPQANNGWNEKTTAKMRELGLWS